MNAIPLSPVDYIFTGDGAQPITFAFSYPNRLDHVRLRNSLNETLDYFPVLRGKLKRISENNYEFHSTENGVEILIVHPPKRI